MYIDFIKLFLSFIFFSFGGYLLEVIVCSYGYKKIVNRGFLFGPICPIYGIGSVIIVWTLSKYYSDPVVVFVFGLIATSLIEYYTSYLLEKIFHNKWWDYSKRKDSINGRICLGNCIGFGIGSCAIIYFFEPLKNRLFGLFSDKLLIIIGSIILVLFIIDLISSVVIAYNLRQRIIIAEELKAEKIKMIPDFINKKYQEQISHLRFARNRLIKVFPNLTKNVGKELDTILKLRQEQKLALKTKNKTLKAKRHKKKK